MHFLIEGISSVARVGDRIILISGSGAGKRLIQEIVVFESGGRNHVGISHFGNLGIINYFGVVGTGNFDINTFFKRITGGDTLKKSGNKSDAGINGLVASNFGIFFNIVTKRGVG